MAVCSMRASSGREEGDGREGAGARGQSRVSEALNLPELFELAASEPAALCPLLLLRPIVRGTPVVEELEAVAEQVVAEAGNKEEGMRGRSRAEESGQAWCLAAWQRSEHCRGMPESGPEGGMSWGRACPSLVGTDSAAG